MHMIAGVLSAIGVAIIGLVGHVVAHDLCLSRATRRLPAANRDRYAEEWAAHLAEAEGVLAKLGHAVGCLWCAHQIQRQTNKAARLEFSFDLPGIEAASLRTNAHEVLVLFWLNKLCMRTCATRSAFIVATAILFFRRLFVDVHKRSGLSFKQFTDFIFETKGSDWQPIAITMNGETTKFASAVRISAGLLDRVSNPLTSRAGAQVEAGPGDDVPTSQTST